MLQRALVGFHNCCLLWGSPALAGPLFWTPQNSKSKLVMNNSHCKSHLHTTEPDNEKMNDGHLATVSLSEQPPDSGLSDTASPAGELSPSCPQSTKLSKYHGVTH